MLQSDIFDSVTCQLKGYSTFLEMGSFYNFLRVKQLSFIVQKIYYVWKSMRPETVRLLIFF